MEVLRFITHSKKVISLAQKHGWYPGARYTNLRDIKTVEFASNGFLDINWKNYSFSRHLEITALYSPRITVARDIECIFQLDAILREAEKLREYSTYVVLVPKDPKLNNRLEEMIPKDFILGYSIPTRYGGTKVTLNSFKRPVHLLGGRPDIQRKIGQHLKVLSLDCNRFTFDAKFGDYFDGETFRPHPIGGYERCLSDSLVNINKLWLNYKTHDEVKTLLRVAS
jgi:hypothetical protein